MGSLDNLNVVKSNSLVRACYKLSLDEQRLILACVAQLDSRRPTKKERVRVYASDYAELFGIDPTSVYKQLKGAINHLYERSIVKIEGELTTKMRWVYVADYHKGEGYVSMGFSPEIEPYLTLLGKKFTKYKLKQAAGLKSPYAVRLLELFMSYSDGWCEIKVDDLRQMLMLEGLYCRFCDLKRRILEPARKELKLQSGLNVTYEVKKRVRKKAYILRFEWKELEGNTHLQEKLLSTA